MYKVFRYIINGTFDAFSRTLNKDQAIAPKWFSTGERNTSIKHARMRMLCSKLNNHLFSHIHVIDSPACQCWHGRENNKQFIIDCPYDQFQTDSSKSAQRQRKIYRKKKPSKLLVMLRILLDQSQGLIDSLYIMMSSKYGYKLTLS